MIFAYDDHPLTEKLNAAERCLLDKNLSTVSPVLVEYLSLQFKMDRPFQGREWLAISHYELPRVALAAFKAGKCSADQFATLSLLWAALKEFVYTNMVYRVDDPKTGKWEKSYKHLYFRGEFLKVVLHSSPKYAKYLKIVFRWKDEWIEKLQDKIRGEIAFPADKCLFVIPMPGSPIEYWGPMIKAVKLATGGNLYPFQEKDADVLGFTRKRKLVLPAFPVLKLLTEWYEPSLPIKLVPRLGAMTEKDVALDRMNFSHVVALGMEELPLPEFADGRPTGPFAFALHDIYHTYTYASKFTYGLTVAINRMLQVLYTLPDDPALTVLRAKLIDAEFMNGSLSISTVLVGDLFSNYFLVREWTLKDSFYKKAILNDISKYKPFWNMIVNDHLGLSSEDAALIPPDPMPTWPPRAELEALHLKEVELVPFLEMAEALQWTQEDITAGINGLLKRKAMMDLFFRLQYSENTQQKALETERERYLLCIEIFQTLPRAESLPEITFIKRAPLLTVVQLLSIRPLLLSGYLRAVIDSLTLYDFKFLEEIQDQVNCTIPIGCCSFQKGGSPVIYYFKTPLGWRVIGKLSKDKRKYLEGSLTLIGDETDYAIKRSELITQVVNQVDEIEPTALEEVVRGSRHIAMQIERAPSSGSIMKFQQLSDLVSRSLGKPLYLEQFDDHDVIEMVGIPEPEFTSLLKLTEVLNWNKRKLVTAATKLTKKACCWDPDFEKAFPENTTEKGMEFERIRYLICFECLTLFSEEEQKNILFMILRLKLSEIVKFQPMFNAMKGDPVMLNFLEKFFYQIEAYHVFSDRFFYFNQATDAESYFFEIEEGRYYVMGAVGELKREFLGHLFTGVAYAQLKEHEGLFNRVANASYKELEVLRKTPRKTLLKTGAPSQPCCSVQ